MGIIDKEGYRRKALYAERKMQQNSDIGMEKGLTEGQCDALSSLCRIRHEMHTNQDAFWFVENSKHSEYWDMIFSNETQYGKINTMLKEVELPIIEFGINDQDYMCASLCSELDLIEEEERANVYEIAEKINNKIETYLLQIDNKYGTSYCPNGLGRLL